MSTALDKLFKRAGAEPSSTAEAETSSAREASSPAVMEGSRVTTGSAPAMTERPSPTVERVRESSEVITGPSIGGREQLRELPIAALSDFPDQPFRPYSADKMEALRESIIRNGIIVRLLVRPRGESGYQIVSGHNRRTAARMAGYVSVPCEVRLLTDDEAQIQMIETNLQQREGLLPSEKAWAYRLRLEAMNRQGMRTDLTLSQVETKTRSDEKLAGETGDSRATIQRYVRLTYLLPALLELVDNKKLGLTVGADLSYLSAENQGVVHNFCYLDHEYQLTQAHVDSLRSFGEKPLTDEALEGLFSPVVAAKPPRTVAVPMKPLRRFFAPETTQKVIQQTIVAALTAYFDGKTTL